jgi:hypothetical protein
MKADVAVQETKGDAQKAVGDAKKATTKAVDDTVDESQKAALISPARCPGAQLTRRGTFHFFPDDAQ